MRERERERKKMRGREGERDQRDWQWVSAFRVWWWWCNVCCTLVIRATATPSYRWHLDETENGVCLLFVARIFILWKDRFARKIISYFFLR